MAGQLTVTPVAGRIGASVSGADLREPPTAALRDEILAALVEHLVLFFPGQHLDDDQHLAFAASFGEPYVHPIGRVMGRDRGGVERIVDDPDHPPYQDRWHTDVSWDPEPPTYGTLRAVEMPRCGGDTVWSSTYAAYEALSPVLRSVLEPLEARHGMGAGAAFLTKAGAEAVVRAREAFPGAVHPVVGVHPDSGRRYLYVNREFTEAIVGMREPESRALLGMLFDHVESPNFALRHTWTVGEVALWDERCTQHFAVADFLPARREMGRVAVRVSQPTVAFGGRAC